jgi:dolichol kinase
MIDKKLAATADLEFIKEIMQRTHRRIDPHTFHFIIWGTLVLFVYPLLNWFGQQENLAAMRWIGIAALAVGVVLSTVTEIRLSRKPRLTGENTFVAKQVAMIVFANIGLASVLSAVGPATGLIPGPYVPVLWGFVYANMAYMVGVVYAREDMVAGAVICVGALLAALLPDYGGFILGPFMGLGMIVPALMAERRVARMRAETGGT